MDTHADVELVEGPKNKSVLQKVDDHTPSNFRHKKRLKQGKESLETDSRVA